MYPKPKHKRKKRSRIIDPEAIEAARREYCQRCGIADAVQVHHIIYRSRGGGDTADNLVSLCLHCHQVAHGLVRGEVVTKEQLRQFKIMDLWEG